MQAITGSCSSQSSHDCQCHQNLTNPSVHQTLDELDFDRGMWSSALAGDIEDVRRKLTSGSHNVNATDKSGYSPLHYSARNGHLEICKLLLSHGAKVNMETRSGEATPLHRAAYMGHSDIVQLLVDCGADPLATDCDGMTPLHKASEKGCEKTVAILFKANPSALKILDNKKRKPDDLDKKDVLKMLCK